jgi:hypothetical protein
VAALPGAARLDDEPRAIRCAIGSCRGIRDRADAIQQIISGKRRGLLYTRFVYSSGRSRFVSPVRFRISSIRPILRARNRASIGLSM